MQIIIEDFPRENIIKHLDAAHDFIDSAIKQGNNILVHCSAGVSRSASIVISYVMKVKKIDYSDAYLLVKTARPIISPNMGFQMQLKKWHELGYTMNEDEMKKILDNFPINELPKRKVSDLF